MGNQKDGEKKKGDFGIGNEVPDTTGILDIGIKSQYQASLVLIIFYTLHRNGVFFFFNHSK